MTTELRQQPTRNAFTNYFERKEVCLLYQQITIATTAMQCRHLRNTPENTRSSI